ncbi:glycosyl hydrolase family 76 domain-containing protein [Sarocladium implicatum]|nr:glycosyl hydrolase family 76 domain-containing protein [Sarocladium implicatum]
MYQHRLSHGTSLGPRRFSQILSSFLLLVWSPFTSAAYYDLDINSTDSIKKVSKTLIEDMLTFYHGDEKGQEPGLLPPPYYWWAAGAMFGTLIDYWYYTGDDSYVNLTSTGLLAQVGEHDDYMPKAQVLNEGNDDQGFWGLAVMSAAEYNFPNPPEDEPQWLALAQAVFNTQASRWDDQHCKGGLRWQIFEWNNGYDYKNSISNGCFFAIAARLALFTGNTSYADWAEKTWEWMDSVELIDQKGYVYDGGHIQDNCAKLTRYQWSYNAGVFINGASAMYNMTGEAKWKDRLDLLLDGVKVFFQGPDKNIMTEVACEPVNRCNLDQQSFKAYLSRWLASTTKWVPETYDFIMPYLRASAEAAISECTGGDNGRMCGLHWQNATWDGSTGVGQQMNVAEVVMGCMVKERGDAKTAKTGGTSKSDPGGGGGDIGRTIPEGKTYPPLNAGDYVGAAILTILFAGGFIAGIFFIMMDETSDKSAMQQLRGFGPSALAVLAGGGAAAGAGVLGKRDSQFNEKGRAATVISERSSQTSSDGLDNTAAPLAPAFAFGHVRSTSEPDRNQRRLSTMPLGWPHNPSMRASQVYETGSGRPMSMQPQSSRLSSLGTPGQSGSLSNVASHPTSIQEVPQGSPRRSMASHRHSRSVNE